VRRRIQIGMRASATAVAVLAGALAASGCGGSGTTQPLAQRSHNRSGPLVVPISAKTRRSLELNLSSARFLSPTRLAIPGIVGSSNCPSVPAKLTVQSRHAIRVDLVVGSLSRTASGRRVEVPRSPGTCLADGNLSGRPSPGPGGHRRRPEADRGTAPVEGQPLLPAGRDSYRRPVVVTVPPLATARIRKEVRVARSSNRLFSIFPKVPGERLCLIPLGGTRRRFVGICRTSVRSRPTHEPSVSVRFTESWWPHCPPLTACSPRALRHHTWRVIEGATIVTPGAKLHVYATRSRGARAPQLSR
jgi:hypothetical protein